jgi:succinate dehydrogenase/fumarate reductase flavoprotein subunit
MENNHNGQTDVLVIGGGGAGLRAAIEAAREGCRVVVMNKGPIGRSGTTPMAMESFQSVCTPGDSEDCHFQDTVEGGRYLGDENLIGALVRDAGQRAKDLESYGVHFKRKKDGTFDPMHHPGQTRPRTLFIQGGGFGMMAGLIREVRKHPAIHPLSDVFTISLIQDREGVPGGAIFLDLQDGRLKTIQSQAVILATGGYEELWSFNDASVTACGDGIFLAWEAGAELVDLEKLQFYPTIVIHPPAIRGTLFQYELIIDPEVLGGRLLNGEGDPFLEGIPLRDAVTKAIWKEIQGGRGTEHGGVFIDLTHSSKTRPDLTEALEKWQPNQFHYLKDMGFDLRDVRIEVAPHAHFTMGGIAADEWSRTTVPGLFAAGEVAGNLHGANRISGNALAETQVFGARAGSMAAAFVRGRKTIGTKEILLGMGWAEALLDGLGHKRGLLLRPHQIRKRMQEIMWRRCGVEREAEGLRRGMAELAVIEKEDLPAMSAAGSGAYPQELLDALEVRMMVPLCRLVLQSALFREESRGHHMRADYPLSHSTAKHVVLARGKEPWAREVKRVGRRR